MVGVIGWLGETGKDGGFIRDIWQALKTASPPVAMIMFFLYMRESQKRDEAQKQCNDRTIDFVKATNLATNTFSRALALISNPRRTVRRTR